MTEHSRLHRGLGLTGAVVVGLSAMLGTGVFVVWTPAIARAGSSLFVALGVAAVIASLNATSTARLARRHPVSGGAYAYGSARIHRSAGIAAGLAFIVGKSASASAAALAIGAYLWPERQQFVAWIALGVAVAIDLRGVVRSIRVNVVLVAIVLVVLALVVAVGATNEVGAGEEMVATVLPTSSASEVLAAAGLLFVAFAGYARIAVLGEEVRRPEHILPRAIAIALATIAVIYAAVAFVVMVAVRGGTELGDAPLADVLAFAGQPGLVWIVTIGAVLAAGSALLSLVSGIGRTTFAMAAAGDAPRVFAAVHPTSKMPHRASLVGAVLAAVFVAVGELGWSLALSGASVLLYYGVAHLAAWTLPERWGRVIAGLGLAGCLTVVGGLVLAGALAP